MPPESSACGAGRQEIERRLPGGNPDHAVTVCRRVIARERVPLLDVPSACRLLNIASIGNMLSGQRRCLRRR